MDTIDDLIRRARVWAIEPGGENPVPEIEALMPEYEGHTLALLHAARAAALQTSDPGLAIADSLDAADLFARAEKLSDAAAMTAAAATLVEMTGDWGRAIELAVAATIQLADAELDDVQAARAASALCAFYGHMGAFELAMPFGRRCVTIAELFPDLPRAALVFNVGALAVEAAHLTTEPRRRDELLADITTIAALMADVPEQPSSAALSASLTASVAMLRGDLDGAREAVRAMRQFGPVAAVFDPWLDVTEAAIARRTGDPATAETLITTAIPGLEAGYEDNTLLRALDDRAAAREALGSLDGALDDIRRRADLARRWHIDRTAQYAALIASQAELERDGSLLRRQAGELARAATEDPLTGLYSRRWLMRRLSELEALDQNGAVLMIDIDHFKVVNDTHGHGVGDKVLAAVSSVLSGSMRDGDVVRYGGEEFLVAITTDARTAVAVAERARLAVTHASFDDIVPDLRLTISIGVAHGPMARIRELIDAADDALYVAKQSGRNRVVTADPLPEGPSHGNAG